MILDLKVPPVAQALFCILVMWLLNKFIPIFSIDFTYQRVLSFVFIGGGILLSLLGVFSFHKSKTTVDPRFPEKSSSLVTLGIYKYTRNPMYLGFLVSLIGCSIYLGSLSSFFLVPLFVLFITKFQIKPEEIVLEQLFGEDYKQYKSRVRRWL